MEKFVVIAGSRPKRAWAGVFPVVAGDWFKAKSVAYYETGCSMWDDCETCSFDDEANTARVLAEAGMVLTGEKVWLTDTTTAEGGGFFDVCVKA
jgi:hypothetical protein